MSQINVNTRGTGEPAPPPRSDGGVGYGMIVGLLLVIVVAVIVVWLLVFGGGDGGTTNPSDGGGGGGTESQVESSPAGSGALYLLNIG